jgi:hypothetical protein
MAEFTKSVSGVVADIRTEATEVWRTPWSVAGAVLYGSVVGGALVALSVAHRPTFRFITREDGVLEWPQFAAFAAAAILAALTAVRLAKLSERMATAVFGLMAVGCVFIAGEEISWGQRILGFETSESWKEINKQNETTVHNVESVLVYFNLAMLFVSLFAVVSSIVYLGRRPGGLPSRLIPPAYLVTAFATMAVYKALRFTVVRGSGFTVVKLGEWAELCMAVGLAVFAAEMLRATGRDLSSAASGGSGSATVDQSSLAGRRAE